MELISIRRSSFRARRAENVRGREPDACFSSMAPFPTDGVLGGLPRIKSTIPWCAEFPGGREKCREFPRIQPFSAKIRRENVCEFRYLRDEFPTRPSRELICPSTEFIPPLRPEQRLRGAATLTLRFDRLAYVPSARSRRPQCRRAPPLHAPPAQGAAKQAPERRRNRGFARNDGSATAIGFRV